MVAKSRFAVAAVVLLTSLGALTSEGKPIVMLTISQPKTMTKEDGASRTGDVVERQHGTERRVTKRQSAYTGKVSCIVGKGEFAQVTVDAFFVTQPISSGTVQASISKTQNLGTFRFGGTNPGSYDLKFGAPSVSQKQTTKRGYHNWYRGGNYSHGTHYTKTSKSGTKHLGVVLRATIDGKVVSVKSMPTSLKDMKTIKEQVNRH